MTRAVGMTILVIVTLAAVLLFPRYFQRVTEREYVGFKGEAARDEHLAAQRFLQRRGHDVQHLRGATQFEKLERDALLLLSRVPSEGERGRMIDWVKRGGQLLLDAPQSQEALLHEVGMRYFWPSYQDPDDEEDAKATQAKTPLPGGKTPEQASPQRPKECAPGRYVCPPAIMVRAGEQVFSLELDYGPRLTTSPEEASQQEQTDQDAGATKQGKEGVAPQAQDEATALRSAWDERGYVMLEYALGRGRITVISNGGLLRNNYIGSHDHAAWLNYLVGPHQRQVWVANVPLSASLWQWLRTHAWPVLLAAAIAISLGLWRAVARFGPLLPADAPGRLSFRDHLVACGRFHWRHAAAGHLQRSVELEAQRALAGPDIATAKAAPRYSGRAAEASVFAQRTRALQQKLLARRAKSNSRQRVVNIESGDASRTAKGRAR